MRSAGRFEELFFFKEICLLPQMSIGRNTISRVSVREAMKRMDSIRQTGNKMERGSLGKTYNN